MELNARKGQRVLYKGKGGWRRGALETAELNDNGLFFTITDKDNNNINTIPIDNIYFDSRELEDWKKDFANMVLWEKEEFIEEIQNSELTDRDGTGYMSDGEYEYYSIPHLNANWIRKQPFDYVVWYCR